MHRRQYIAHRRDGFYEILKWRSHAAKFELWRAAQIRQHITFIITSKSDTDSHQKARKVLAAMLMHSPLSLRVKVWMTILFARLFRWLRGGYRAYQPKVRAAAA